MRVCTAGLSMQVMLKWNFSFTLSSNSNNDPLPHFSLGARVAFFNKRTVTLNILETFIAGNSIFPKIEVSLKALYLEWSSKIKKKMILGKRKDRTGNEEKERKRKKWLLESKNKGNFKK